MIHFIKSVGDNAIRLISASTFVSSLVIFFGYLGERGGDVVHDVQGVAVLVLCSTSCCFSIIAMVLEVILFAISPKKLNNGITIQQINDGDAKTESKTLKIVRALFTALSTGCNAAASAVIASSS